MYAKVNRRGLLIDVKTRTIVKEIAPGVPAFSSNNKVLVTAASAMAWKQRTMFLRLDNSKADPLESNLIYARHLAFAGDDKLLIAFSTQ